MWSHFWGQEEWIAFSKYCVWLWKHNSTFAREAIATSIDGSNTRLANLPNHNVDRCDHTTSSGFLVDLGNETIEKDCFQLTPNLPVVFGFSSGPYILYYLLTMFAGVCEIRGRMLRMFDCSLRFYWRGLTMYIIRHRHQLVLSCLSCGKASFWHQALARKDSSNF